MPDISTDLVHAGVTACPVTGAISTPIYQNTTFVQESVETYLSKGYSYSRQANPTVRALEKKIAAVEGAYDSCCFSSGMAATNTVLSAMLKPGDHCVMTNCSYGGTNRCARVLFSKYGIEFSFVDFRDLNAVKNAIKKETVLVFSETPTNPTLHLADIRAISDLCKEAGTKFDRRVYHVCDGTFAPPCIMRAIDFGVDMVIQSTTKFFDGHNVTVGGAVSCATADLDEQIRFHQNVLGNIMTPQIAFYTMQTMKTLKLRVTRQSETALAIAQMLKSHPKVASVAYPGLPDHPQHSLALKQHKDGIHGGMVACEVHGGSGAGVKLMNSVKAPWSLCENLGAAESIITCPAVMTHANMLTADRLAVGITDGFIRLSCGLEDKDELIKALREGLDNL